MKLSRPILVVAAIAATLGAAPSSADDKAADRFQPLDVFQLEHASDPQISPDGKQVVYVRNFMDVKKDRRRSHLWIVNADGTEHRPVTDGDANEHSPRWSPDGKRLLYLSGNPNDGPAQLHCRWMDTGQAARLAQLPAAPSELAWAPDGKSIAFVMHVADRPEPLVKLPKPEGAEWAESFKEIRSLNYRHDGKGYLKEGHHHVFVLPADGGTPRQLTKGPHEHRGPLAWTPDGKTLLVTANRNPEGEYDPLNTEIYEVGVADGAIKALTKRQGPDGHPAISPDGKQIAYLGFDDKRQGYQVTRLYVMNRDGTGSKLLTGQFDRDVRSPVWNRDGNRVYFQIDDQGDTKVGHIDPLSSKVETVAEHVGGTTLDRPYSSGSFSVAGDGTVAFTLTTPDRPADVAVRRPGDKEARRLTRLNDSLLGHKALATVEEIRYKSSHDGRQIHGWIVKPPGFDPKKKYPLILEIHGGPFANYGPRFAADMQLYAAAGYVVFYANPRGSTSYGEEFGNLIHHAYPGNDYDDLMSGVDAVLKLGYVDEKNMFVTGGSGGGVLSAWIIGKTDRFRAAVVCKPVINWYSFVLTADVYPFFTRNWFPGPPWEHAEHYLKRSPLSLVGNVQTPTMLITGEADHRTPMSESEQYYQALKLRKVETVLVRVPGAPHDIAHRPSHMMMKAAYVLKWFDIHRQSAQDSIFVPGAKLTVEAEGGVGGEGPAWHPQLGVLSSGNGHINQLERKGESRIWRKDAGTNGLLFDVKGRLLACEPKLRRVTRTESDGKVTVLTESYEGKRYNQPNDITVDSQGRIYFTDPRYGSREGMEILDDQGRTIEGVYRIDLDGKVTRIIGRELDRPNGILVSADDRFLFVADNNNDTKDGARKLWRFDLKKEGTVDLASKKLLHDWGKGRGPDGIKQDQQGRLYVAGGLNKPNPPFEPAEDVKGGVYVISPEGKLLDFLPVPRDEVTNCAFGGDDLKTLYITAGGTLYSIRTTTPGRVVFPASK